MKILTLAEYLADKNPIGGNIVRLQKGDYKVLNRFINKPGTPEAEPVTIIRINGYPDYEYVQRGKILQLFGYVDNCNKGTCFWLSETENLVEWLIISNGSRLITTFPEIASFAGVPLVRAHEWHTWTGGLGYEYKVAIEGDKIDIARIREAMEPIK